MNRKKKFIYDYYIVSLENDFVKEAQEYERNLAIAENRMPLKLPYSLRHVIYLEAERKVKVVAMPCEWKIINISTKGAYYIFKVRRKRFTPLSRKITILEGY
jgi:hypothetical protein